jgi:hypothetical protein
MGILSLIIIDNKINNLASGFGHLTWLFYMINIEINVTFVIVEVVIIILIYFYVMNVYGATLSFLPFFPLFSHYSKDSKGLVCEFTRKNKIHKIQ